MSKELLKKYKLLFGEDAPIPPEHIMKTLVKMKEKGTFEKNIKAIEENYEDIKKYSKEKLGRELTLDDPFFDIDFEKDDK